MKISLRKRIFLVPKNVFSLILISKMGVKLHLRIITKNHAADPEIEFLTKTISKPNGRATAMPTAWELRFIAKFQIFRLVAFFIPLFIES